MRKVHLINNRNEIQCGVRRTSSIGNEFEKLDSFNSYSPERQCKRCLAVAEQWNNSKKQEGTEMTTNIEIATAIEALRNSPQRSAIAYPEDATIIPVNDPIHPERICRVHIPIINNMRESVYIHTICDGDMVAS